MNLYFRNANGEEKLIGTPENDLEVVKIMHDFLEEHNFKSYYTRTWVENNRKWFDVGSHSEFFVMDIEK